MDRGELRKTHSAEAVSSQNNDTLQADKVGLDFYAHIDTRDTTQWKETKMYGPLRRLTSSSCGQKRAFHAVFSYFRPLFEFVLVILETLKNIKKSKKIHTNPKNQNI